LAVSVNLSSHMLQMTDASSSNLMWMHCTVKTDTYMDKSHKSMSKYYLKVVIFQ